MVGHSISWGVLLNINKFWKVLRGPPYPKEPMKMTTFAFPSLFIIFSLTAALYQTPAFHNDVGHVFTVRKHFNIRYNFNEFSFNGEEYKCYIISVVLLVML